MSDMPQQKDDPDQDIEDALGDLFPDEDENAEPPKRQSDDVEKRQSANTPTSGSPNLLSPSGQETVRINGPYVEQPVKFRLEEVQIRLRRMTGEAVTKSEIIEAALRLGLQEFEEGGAESALVKLVRRLRQ